MANTRKEDSTIIRGECKIKEIEQTKQQYKKRTREHNNTIRQEDNTTRRH